MFLPAPRLFGKLLYLPIHRRVTILQNQIWKIRMDYNTKYGEYGYGRSHPAVWKKYYDYCNCSKNPYIIMQDRNKIKKMGSVEAYITYLLKARKDLYEILNDVIDLTLLKSEIRNDELEKIMKNNYENVK